MYKFFRNAYLTGFGVGYMPFAPGTFGSLVAFPIMYFVVLFSISFKFRIGFISYDTKIQEIAAIFLSLIFLCVLILVASIPLCNNYIKDKEKSDPKEVVIDEILGQMLTVILSYLNVVFAHFSYLKDNFSVMQIDIFFLIILPFVTFRFFDILKPWPIGYIDKNVKNGLGVMLDDIVAAIFAAIMCYAITFLIIGDLEGAK
jgi:phosphatidylglycerophosphatase A